MVEIHVNNDKSFIVYKNEYRKNDIERQLRLELSYEIPNKDWNTKYKTTNWDGRIPVYDKSNGSFPTGLYRKVVNVLKGMRVDAVTLDNRIKPAKSVINSIPTELRPKQIIAKDTFLKSGRGVLELSVAFGKTRISSQIIAELSVLPVIFIVPSISLVNQTFKEFSERLNVPIGRINGGICDIQPITVSTYHSLLTAFNLVYKVSEYKVVTDEFAGEKVRKTYEQLVGEKNILLKKYDKTKEESEIKWADFYIQNIQSNWTQKNQDKYDKFIEKDLIVINRELNKINGQIEDKSVSLERKKRIREFVESVQFVIVDEVHLAVDSIGFVLQHAKNAFYRMGLSGTLCRTDNKEILIEGAIGKTLMKVPASEMIQDKFLIQPTITGILVPDQIRADNYREAYKQVIVENEARNEKIKEIAIQQKQKGMPTLIYVDEIQHGKLLESMIPDSVFVSGTSDGETDDETIDYRRHVLNKTEKNEIILICTSWIVTGIDFPKAQSLLFGGIFSSLSPIIQCIGRVLRLAGKTFEESIANGKDRAEVFYFIPTNKQMRNQVAQFEKVIRTEPEFILNSPIKHRESKI